MLVQGRHGCLRHLKGIFEKCWGRTMPVPAGVQLSILPDRQHLMKSTRRMFQMLLHPGMVSPDGIQGSYYSFRLASEASGIVFGHRGISRAPEKSCSPDQGVMVLLSLLSSCSSVKEALKEAKAKRIPSRRWALLRGMLTSEIPALGRLRQED